MKKKVCVCALILTLAIGLFSCSDNDSDSKSSDSSIFTVVSNENGFKVMYDNQTKVMYTVVNGNSYARGVVTLLVNPDGTPKLWMGGE